MGLQLASELHILFLYIFCWFCPAVFVLLTFTKVLLQCSLKSMAKHLLNSVVSAQAAVCHSVKQRSITSGVLALYVYVKCNSPVYVC